MKKKLIEVSLPLEAINIASAREKSIRHGHPSTLHLWWARRPLAACRAVLFASLVDDPSSLPEQFPTEEEQIKERRRLHEIIERLVLWENSNNETVLAEARAEIMRSTNNNPPPVYDPFAGGGSIPLEAQRLGLEAHASDLNPVAVLINKALIEIPPKFAGQPPVNPSAKERENLTSWKGAAGLAEDVRYYGKWMRDEAEKRIGHLYPKVKAVQNDDGKFRHATVEEIESVRTGSGSDRLNVKIQNLTVIAWLWARTVKCPNPQCGAMMPLVRSFALSTKKGKETHVSPVINHDDKTIRFEIQTAKSKIQNQSGTVDRRGARCLVCETLAPLDHVRAEGKAGRMTAQMMAIVAEGNRGRIYLAPNVEQASIAAQAKPTWKPDAVLPLKHRNFQTPGYGMTNVGDLFTDRQLVALTTFSDLVGEARGKILEDARKSKFKNGESYANAVVTYLAFAIDKCVDYWNTIATWASTGEFIRSCFARQAIAMSWDYTECNAFSSSTANFDAMIDWTTKAISSLPAKSESKVNQLDATKIDDSDCPMFSTDPPYYDNIAYADLSDFFYVWLKRSVGKIYPEIFSTLLVPKTPELVAIANRFGGDKQKAKEFFENGLNQVFEKMCETQNRNFPITVYYAFKQAEGESDEGNETQIVTASTGWETMLEGLIKSGFQITGTIPMRTERGARTVSIGANALASSIILVCRPRPEDTPTATRGEFLRTLKRELPDALRKLQESNIAPVDLAQASIGPGMAVYSRYSKVVESDGSPMKVRAALGIINQILDEVLAEQDSEYDSETRWAIDWFAQFGMNAGAFGDAETLSKAKNTSVAGMESSGIISSRAGKVKLLSRDELKPDWNPDTDNRLTIWEITQHLIRILETQGEQAAAKILNSEAVGYQGDIAKDLAYRLYNFCERKGWAQEALAYNSLIVSWNDVQKQAAEQAGQKAAEQASFDFE